MARFTSEQKKLAEGMETLIDLYHMIESMQGEHWFSELVIKAVPDKVVEKMATFFDHVIPNFSPALFFPEKGLFHFRTNGTSVSVNMKRHFTDFLNVMNAIRDDYLSGKLAGCLRVDKVIYETIGISGANPAKIFTTRPKAGSRNVPANAVFKIVQPPAQTGSRASIRRYIKSEGSDLNSPPLFYETFEVAPENNSEFYSQLVTTDLPLDPNEDSPIMSPKDAVQCSFIGVIRYFLVKYWVVFGSFERLKACNRCKKLLFEKKLGAREFCSGLCRKQYHDASQPREKRLCRERQNFWIRSGVGKLTDYRQHYTVSRDDCEKCKTCSPSGSCPVLNQKQKKTIQEIKLHRKQKRKKSIIRARRRVSP